MPRDPRVAALAWLRTTRDTHRKAVSAERKLRTALNRAILNAHAKGISATEIGRELDVTSPAIHHIIREANRSTDRPSKGGKS